MKKYYISEVIDEIGISKLTWLVFSLVGLTMILDSFEFGLAPYTMPQIAKEWGLTKVQTGSISSWGLLGLVIGGAIAGFLSDRIGRKKTLVIACCIYSIFTPLIYFAQSFEMYAILRILGGIGMGAALPVSITVMSEFAPTKRRGIFVTSVMAFYVAGGILCGMAAIFIVPKFGWRFMYLLGGISLIQVFVLAAFLPESMHWLLSKGRVKEVIKTIQVMEKSVKGSATEWTNESFSVLPPINQGGVRALFSPEYRRQTIGLWLMYFMGCTTLYAIMMWMPTLLYGIKGLSLSKSYSFSLSQNIAAGIANVGTGYMADRIGRRRNGYLGFILSILIIPTLAFASGEMQLLLSVFFVGFVINYAVNTAQPIIAETYRTEFRNTGVSLATSFGRLGGFIGPLLMGLMQQMGVGFKATIMSLVIPAVLGIIVILLLVRHETKGRTFEAQTVGAAGQ